MKKLKKNQVEKNTASSKNTTRTNKKTTKIT